MNSPSAVLSRHAAAPAHFPGLTLVGVTAGMQEDPELQSFFEQIKAGGMPAMMQAMNDPMFLQKFSEKMGDLDDVLGPAQPPPTTAAAAAAQGPPAEVNDILDAAKVGDIEAIEDFVAIGKCDITDEAGRGALHYAVAYNQGAAASALLEAGADVNAVDSEGNTPLHFACGYGRGNAARALLAKGADTGLKNSDGKSIYVVLPLASFLVCAPHVRCTSERRQGGGRCGEGRAPQPHQPRREAAGSARRGAAGDAEGLNVPLTARLPACIAAAPAPLPSKCEACGRVLCATAHAVCCLTPSYSLAPSQSLPQSQGLHDPYTGLLCSTLP